MGLQMPSAPEVASEESCSCSGSESVGRCLGEPENLTSNPFHALGRLAPRLSFSRPAMYCCGVSRSAMDSFREGFL